MLKYSVQILYIILTTSIDNQISVLIANNFVHGFSIFILSLHGAFMNRDTDLGS